MKDLLWLFEEAVHSLPKTEEMETELVDSVSREFDPYQYLEIG